MGRLSRRRRGRRRRPCIAPAGFGRLLQPLTVVHPEWVGERIETLTDGARPLPRAARRARRLLRRRGRSCRRCWSCFYLAVVHALDIPITAWDLAVIVPLSFVVQMLPVSVNGFGVREATFSFYFTRLGLPIESASRCRSSAPALIMLFSLSGAALYMTRPKH